MNELLTKRKLIANVTIGLLVLVVIMLACSLIGTIGEQNFICYFGFSLALAALPHWPFLSRLLWLAASVSWMTIFGYAMQRASVSGGTVMMLRLLAAAGAVSLILFLTRRKLPAQT